MSLVRTAPDHSIQVILAPAMSAKSIEREMAAYRNSPERELYAWVERGRPVAAAGLRRTGDAAELLHIATPPPTSGAKDSQAVWCTSS